MTRAVAVAVLALALPTAASATTALSVRTSAVGGDPIAVGEKLDLLAEVRGTGIRASTLAVTLDPGPLSALASPRITRTVRDGVVILRFVQPVACLDNRCAPTRAGSRAIVVRGARATAVAENGSHMQARSPAVSLEVAPVVPTAIVDRGGYRSDTRIGQPAFRVTPAWTAAVAVVVAVALGLASLALVRAERRRRTPAGRSDPLARAIRLTRESVTRSAVDRRRAVDLLARTVAEHDATELASTASRLAWSRPAPEPTRTGRLADAAERGADDR